MSYLRNLLNTKQAAEKQRPTTVLNAHEILNAAHLQWQVVRYHVTRRGKKLALDDQPSAKHIMWKYAIECEAHKTGISFVVQEGPESVVVPASWKLQDHPDYEGYRIERDKGENSEFLVQASNPAHRKQTQGILKKALRNHLIKRPPANVSALWQDYHGFCEVPDLESEHQGIFYCQRFEVLPEMLKGNRWATKIALGTMAVDARSFADYYRDGDVDTLNDHIRLKLKNPKTRKGKDISVRALHIPKDGLLRTTAVKMADPWAVDGHTSMSPSEQRAFSKQSLMCETLTEEKEIPLSELHLILDSQITQASHDLTILPTEVRHEWFKSLWMTLNGFETFSLPANLSDQLYAVSSDPVIIPLPALKTRTGKHREDVGILPAPPSDRESINRRIRERAHRVKNHGYVVEGKAIIPLLAIPHQRHHHEQARRLRKDLLDTFARQGVACQMGEPVVYTRATDIVQECKKHHINTVIAVLPEGKNAPEGQNDTHERIKKATGMPISQCIHFDNTLSPKYAGEDLQNIPFKARGPFKNYEVLVSNLLVKAGWIPFLPAEPCHFNVHLGIDVGGFYNNHAMACMGYGMSSEQMTIFSRAIHVDQPQVEPIPPQHLAQSLSSMFGEMAEFMKKYGVKANFERVLFFRDGDFTGDGDEWQEVEGLTALHAHLMRQGLVSEQSVWVAVEVSKRAGHWRQFHQEDGHLKNPLVGTVTFPFLDPNVALLSTTGDPYVRNGTASPLIVRMKGIHGTFETMDVLRDLLWESDMCFTKVDTGMSLPLVLHAADQGAFQAAKLYSLSGLTLS